MRIDANRSRPHRMRIERIRIQCELSQSTFGGGLNANWKWIGLTYVIISS